MDGISSRPSSVVAECRQRRESRRSSGNGSLALPVLILLVMLVVFLLGRIQIAEARDILYPDEFNFSGVTLLPNGVNVCKDSSSRPICCPHYARENEFSLHCLLFANQTQPLYVTHGHQDCRPGDRPSVHNCGTCFEDIIVRRRCICANGYRNVSEKCVPCYPGTAGSLCASTTSCGANSSCNGRGICSASFGYCDCIFGWAGEECEHRCDVHNGRYGSYSECRGDCHIKCANHVTCILEVPRPHKSLIENRVMHCLCPPGLDARPPARPVDQQHVCDVPCTGKRYGHNCMHTCNCTRGVCDNSIGCLCPDGFMGINCDRKCEKYYYGPQCNQTCDCVHGCHPSTGVCHPCKDPTHGNGTVCVKCTCGSEPGNLSVCIPTQFECGCKIGYGRQNGTCLPCPLGSFGDQCSQLCNCHNNATCDRETGCICTPGYRNSNCSDTCSGGKYGDGCAKTCTLCPKILDHHSCHHVDGRCQCAEGLFGHLCGRRCPEEWNFIPLQPSAATTLDGDSTDALTTSAATGTTAAPAASSNTSTLPIGSTTTAGTQLPATTLPPPLFHSCQLCLCHRNNSHTCNESGGHCHCKPGWTQASGCHAPCPTGHYGGNCTSKCDCENGDCNHVNGSCSCFPGYHGHRCRKRCVDGKFGLHCAHRCECTSGAETSACNVFDGVCQCKPGYVGRTCSEMCNGASFGAECKQQCDCLNGGKCHHETGLCMCSDLLTGTKCETRITIDPVTAGNEEDGGKSNQTFELTLICSIGGVLVIVLGVAISILCKKAKGRMRTYRDLPTGDRRSPAARRALAGDAPANPSNTLKSTGNSNRDSNWSGASGLSRAISSNPGYDSVVPRLHNVSADGTPVNSSTPTNESTRNPTYPVTSMSRRSYERLGLKANTGESSTTGSERGSPLNASMLSRTQDHRRSDADDLSLGHAPRANDYHMLSLAASRHGSDVQERTLSRSDSEKQQQGVRKPPLRENYSLMLRGGEEKRMMKDKADMPAADTPPPPPPSAGSVVAHQMPAAPLAHEAYDEADSSPLPPPPAEELQFVRMQVEEDTAGTSSDVNPLYGQFSPGATGVALSTIPVVTSTSTLDPAASPAQPVPPANTSERRADSEYAVPYEEERRQKAASDAAAARPGAQHNYSKMEPKKAKKGSKKKN
ncbi:multiple epidermal growth factor-like domains protein 11 isoform X1 [Sycon ciliatum]|uniref:multiple epidermal growth factor-like domains protein 11 isoform X1 n=1 Tax=Sycon ciliatum TaxID=27933 RepID=UPI0031F64677